MLRKASKKSLVLLQGGFMQVQQIQKAAMTIDEAAVFTGFTKNYLYKLVHQKRIPFYKPLKGRLFLR